MRPLVLFLFVATAFCACNSDTTPDPVPDYRDVFEGEYIGVRTNTSWLMNGPSTSSETADTVSVIAVGDSSIIVGITEIHVNPNGEFYEQGNGVSSFFSGEFSNGNRLQTDQNSGGLGGGNHSTFIGQKN